MSAFEAREEKDGVRLSWNVLPRSKFQHQRNVIPFGSMYTPLNNKSESQLLAPNSYITCRQCYSVLNPYAFINNNLWTCQFCSFTNQFPPNIPPAAYMPVLDQSASTIEYLTGKTSQLPPIFFFVVDTCFEDEDVSDAFASLKESLIISLSLLPENALVGFISFGKHVQIHDLTSNDIKSFTFNGNKEYTLDQISKSLGLLAQGLSSNHNDNNGYSNLDRVIGPIGRRFLQPVSLVEYQLTNIIENLIPNSFPHSKSKQRLDRATGSAINIASLLLKSILGDHITTTRGHILCFIGGMATFGPGKIVSNLLKEPLRSHHDIEKYEHSTLPQGPTTSTKTKSDTSLFTKAKKFYHEITKTLISLGLSCNFFIGSYNQVGLFEMDEICYKTGGTVVMSDSFNTAIFKQSFIKFFKKKNEEDADTLDMGFNATLEVKACPDLKIQGLIGNGTAIPCIRASDEKYLSTYIMGESGSNCWKLCNVNPQSTYAIYFDKVNSNVMGFTYIQFLFHYQHPSGEMRLRVTTIPVNVVSDTDMATLELGFDQEAAVVLLARDAINKLQPGNFNTAADSKKTTTSQKSTTIIKNLDQMLINFCTRFAVYTAGIFDSFQIAANYSLLPQFMFNLRRSQFINVFGNSPDETSYIRHVFMHEDVNNALLMIQPLLLSYDIDQTFEDEETGETHYEAAPALLDSASLGHGKMLLLDTFFHILIHHGSTVAEWRKAGYQDLPEYEHIKSFLDAPKQEAMQILMERFPLPRFIDCDEGGSQARFLMAKLNPSTSYATNPNHLTGIGSRYDVFTDDTSYQVFMNHIQKNVTSQK
ncbi:hypothetical protein DFJ63DRAFT_214275 [Scheffersomyces coipomensis]|uniref:uncharacterized protein n=1 Tax=Scheffersomyces coipomensis TaxID=1788519 RepID=UPI00315CE795